MYNYVNLIGTCKSIEKVEHEISHTKIEIEIDSKLYNVCLFGYIQDIAKDINIQKGDLICVKGCLDYLDNQLIVKAERLVALVGKKEEVK